VQAQKALDRESWDAAATMARRAVQATSRHLLGKKVGTLNDEIKVLVDKQIIPKAMGDWATHVRLLGADGAHPDPDEAHKVTPEQP
jgi:hypothetical protein